MKVITLYIACIFLSFGAHAQQTPAKKQLKPISIQGATLHIGNGEIIENSLVVFENGKITYAGSNVQDNVIGSVIDASSKHIYPGFIAPNTTLGLVEIGAVRATDDISEIGEYNPHIRSLIAYNAESKIVESMRPNGVLVAQVTPRGGRISGTSSIVQLDAWNWEDAVLKSDDAMHINWPDLYTRGRWWLGEDPGYTPNKKYPEQVAELQMFFNQAKALEKTKTSSEQLPYEAMQEVFENKQKVFIHVNYEKGILEAIAFAKKNKITSLVIVGGDEAYKVGKTLKDNNIPVLLARTHSLPNKEDDDYDLPYKNAKLLVDMGILVGLQNSGQMERANARNLPFQAGTVAAHGLDKEKALQLITYNNAVILGIDDLVGTIAVGKDATLFISKGDALDMRTNQLEKVFIQGRDVSLETHQTTLYKRYSNKYGQ
ncbi:amidohydrolase family protein [Aquimarina sp. W85]|uniref:amidohydrolase family protein n=1 Tax=Aquimarina rhodophyticola TaxID=3342246 RepID=UPI00366F61FF